MTLESFPDFRHVDDEEASAVIFAPGQYPDIEGRVRAHAARCEKCAERLRVLGAVDSEVASVLTVLDDPAPSISAVDVIARARKSPRSVGVMGGGRRVAAAIALISAAAVAAAALPASPLHKLILRELESAGKSRAPAAQPRAVVTVPSIPPGVFLTADSSLDIIFVRRNTRGVVHVRVVDGPQASLTSPDSGSRFRVSRDRIVVDQSQDASFELALPRSLRAVRVWTGGELALDRRHGSLAGGPASFTIQLFGPHSTTQVP